MYIFWQILYLISDHFSGSFHVLGDDPGARQAHEESNEEQAEEHDEDQQKLPLVHCV